MILFSVVGFVGWVVCDSCLLRCLSSSLNVAYHMVLISLRDSVRGYYESDRYVVAQERDQWSQLCVPSPFIIRTSSCFVTSVLDILGDLRMWLGMGVIASDQDAAVSVTVCSICHQTFRWCQNMSNE